MNYFVNENIFTLNSGTEFSAIKRLKMFKNHQVEAKILTKNYNPQLSGDLKRVDLTHDDVINMYDYFQEVMNVPEKDVDVRYTEKIDKRKYHIEGIDANESLIKHAGQTIAKVLIAPATVGLVGSMEFNDSMNHVIAKDIWDRRGFLSSTQYFHPDGTLGPQIFFDINGTPKLEITHMNIQGILNPTMYKLLNYKGKNRRFNREEELFSFFMNELAGQEPSVFINDRPSLISAVASIKGAVGKWQFLHNSHSKNNQQAGASRLVVDYLQNLFTVYKNSFDGLIVPTAQQKKEIIKYYDFKHVIALTDTFSKKIKKSLLRDRNKIVYVGRLSVEKKPADVVEIFAEVHRRLPETSLDFYGYSSPLDVQKDLEKLIEANNLKNVVKFKGYQSRKALDEALDNAGLLLNTSEGEAFGMNVLEALNHGVPVVAYKVKYGLSEQIEDGKNGYLVPYGAIQAASNSIVEILESEENWEKFSNYSYEKSKEYNEEAVWSQWLNEKVNAESLFIK
ncbi:accessory Sec system glycosyltransferase Asp1 [Lactococcus sp. NH2-7C]|jgi:poly(glycerol-phosphate) alpha-glucosyltransferase|uniref:accessory Sec system glycosyltransferase Asp1 n=1 Tax=Lactococcus sp. NH2-7C TaxID=2879149 RepID=UPI001CDBC18B|nr:accessory Sec system glycosyltransferase Asp1 [Lactococcus sp. NH2-7C]MCA2390929.1 accessory Sec system glycosyltransferase Asp1 [Lactococcus sp. NH2-7C]WGV30819.1 accessory Sec system glycosyltransferase Asp1 [Lactococcus sp. NH2-7C]